MSAPVLAIFNLPGPEFLGFYGILGIITLIVSLKLRARVLRQFEAAHAHLAPPASYPAEILGFVVGGELGVLRAAVAGLIHRRLVKVLPDGRLKPVDPTQDKAEMNLDPIEATLLAALESRDKGDGVQLDMCRRDFRTMFERIKSDAEKAGLILDTHWTSRFVASARVPWLVYIVIGVIKTGIGANRGHPVGFLVAMMIVAFLLTSMLGDVPRPARARTIVGKAADRHVGLRPAMVQSPKMLTPQEAMLGAAIFGLHAFGNEIARVDAQEVPAGRVDGSTTTSSCSSSCGGSCGGGCGGCS